MFGIFIFWAIAKQCNKKVNSELANLDFTDFRFWTQEI